MKIRSWPRMAFVFTLSFTTIGAYAAQTQNVKLQAGSEKENSLSREDYFLDRTESKVVRIDFRMKELKLKEARQNGKSYKQLSLEGIPLTTDVGMPTLPFKAVTVDAAREDIRIEAMLGEPVSLKVGRIFPAQEEPCRCDDPARKAPVFMDHLAEFQPEENFYRIDSLGDYRGKPVNRVVLLPHRYDSNTGTLLLYPNARYEISYLPRFTKSAESESSYDYLVISSREFISTLQPWLDWKHSSQGLRMNVVAYEDLGVSTSNDLKTWIHGEYARARFKFALIVGGQNRIPQQVVETTTNRATPSDLPYYTMGAADDIVPEVYAGRIVADNPETVARVLRKWMIYESDTGSSAPGWSRAIGVASNEGANPSDAEYVLSIQSALTAAFGTQSIYLYENDPASNPANFNQEMNGGAGWLTYLGHGSGTSWSSFGQTYDLAGIAALRNGSAVKPIWIDVACLNGELVPRAAGAHLMGDADPSGAPIGVTGYYGGTVLISWHPPAIFARGLAYHVSATIQPVLGEALQAGQKYLSENHSGLVDLASNQRWYHLQGDPSMRLRLR